MVEFTKNRSKSSKILRQWEGLKQSYGEASNAKNGWSALLSTRWRELGQDATSPGHCTTLILWKKKLQPADHQMSVICICAVVLSGSSSWG